MQFENITRQYLYAALVISCGLVLDAVIYLVHPVDTFHHAFALLELCWLFVCIVALPLLYRRNREFGHPLLFITYEFAFYFLLASTINTGDSAMPEFPLWYVVAVIGFGVFYAWYTFRRLKVPAKY